MKNKITVIIILPLMAVMLSCGSSLKSDESKYSYSIGRQIGNNIKSRGIEMDIDAFIAGVKDVMKGKKSKLTGQEIQQAMMALNKKMSEKNAEKFKKNIGISKKFLEENLKKPGIKVTASGLQYKVIKKGYGKKPSQTSKVKVHYRGKLVNGTEFDSSYKRGKPVVFGVGQVIPGWTEALKLMSVGAKYKLYIPSKLGYGPQGTRGIPGYSVLVFDVELLGIE